MVHQLFHEPSNELAVLDLTKEASSVTPSSTPLNSQQFEASFNARDYIGLHQHNYETDLTGEGITVAILDTGIDPNHHVFTADGSQPWHEKIVAFYDEEIEALRDLPFDVQWHGTWTASILGGKGSNYNGIAPNVKLLVLKVFYYDEGELSSNIPTLEKAIDWIVENYDLYNIRVVSMSFGAKSDGNQEDLKYLHDLMEPLTKENILVVAAAGNHGNDPKSITAPASAASVLAVGGVDFFGNMYSKSGAGPTFEGLTKPDVCAPSISIKGAKAGTLDEYSTHTGTSAATPFVSGLAALMLEKNPDLSWQQLKNIISLTSVRTIDPYRIKDNIQGWGIIQGYAALSALDVPVTLQENLAIRFTLNRHERVFCLPIDLNPGHWFIQLTESGAGNAAMYLFDHNPDPHGNPILISHTANIDLIGDIKRLGVYSADKQEYYLVVKLLEGANIGDHEVSIQLVIEHRLGILFIIFCANLTGLASAIIYLKKSLK